MFVLWTVLGGCNEPEEGVPDPSDCQPISVESQCSIWECWQARDDGLVAYTYASGWDGSEFDLRSSECWGPYRCCQAEQSILRKACPDSPEAQIDLCAVVGST
jgi:hypothetical protein